MIYRLTCGISYVFLQIANYLKKTQTAIRQSAFTTLIEWRSKSLMKSNTENTKHGKCFAGINVFAKKHTITNFAIETDLTIK